MHTEIQPSSTESIVIGPPEHSTEATAPPTLGERVRAFRERNKKKEAVVFFLSGFCFDLLLLERIDSVPMLIHQGSYLLLLSILLAVDHHFTVRGEPPPGFWARVLHFRHEVIHFLFGTLLNAFLVFYFKASSGLIALAFMAALGALLIANETPRFRKLGPMMRVALLSFAITSYFSYLLPVLAGFLSPYLFLTAVFLASVVTYALWRFYSAWTHDPAWTLGRAVLPGLAIQALLVTLYFLHVVPPVPLSLKWIGIYHDVQRQGKTIKLLHQRAPWKVWQHGDQTFLARVGDRIFCFVRVFAPRHFRDGLKVRWAYRDARSIWQRTDAIPLTITGGQEQGWRGVAYKRNYTPGQWKVEIETDDGREVGNIRFVVVEDLSTEPRTFQEEIIGASKAPATPPFPLGEDRGEGNKNTDPTQ